MNFKNKSEMRKEIKSRWVAAILSALFLLGAFKCTSQVVRQKYPNGVVLSTSDVLKFNIAGTDTCYLSIYADSSSTGYEVVMAVSYPDYFDISYVELYIGMQYGDNEAFLPTRLDFCTNTAEFVLTSHQIAFLMSSPLGAISFNDRYTERVCYSIKNKRYFMRFLNDYKR